MVFSHLLGIQFWRLHLVCACFRRQRSHNPAESTESKGGERKLGEDQTKGEKRNHRKRGSRIWPKNYAISSKWRGIESLRTESCVCLSVWKTILGFSFLLVVFLRMNVTVTDYALRQLSRCVKINLHSKTYACVCFSNKPPLCFSVEVMCVHTLLQTVCGGPT